MSTLKLRYIGDHRTGVVVNVHGVQTRVGYRHEVELPADVAKSLLAQPGQWEEVKPKGQKDEVA